VESVAGKGSTFFAIIPVRYEGASEASLMPETRELDPTRLPILVVEDNAEVQFIYEKYLRGAGYEVLQARSLAQARHLLRSVRPAAVILDILLESEATWSLLTELKGSDATHDIPVVVVTMVDNERLALSQGADAFALKPVDRVWLMAKLEELIARTHRETILIVDDDAASRYLLRTQLAGLPYAIVEAQGGAAGVDLARKLKPRVIFLDLAMPEVDGFAVISQLRGDDATRQIPIIVHSALELDAARWERLGSVAAVLPKNASRETMAENVRRALRVAGLGEPAKENSHV
jgi:CheY-like chemotaxis protein